MRTATKLAMRDKEAQMKGQHRLDFNLYGIEVKPARHYRLMDGRIDIAKFKGTSNRDAPETYRHYGEPSDSERDMNHEFYEQAH